MKFLATTHRSCKAGRWYLLPCLFG